MKFLFLISFLMLSACSNQNFKSRTVENYYQSAGVEKYFLSELPEWANFSTEGNCKRTVSVRFFNIDLLMKNYNLDFNQAIQIQATYNDEYINLVKNSDKKILSLSDEQLIFFKASDKVNGNIKYFTPPKFKRINLVWIDSLVASKVGITKLKTFLKSKIFDSGVPVLVSMCLSKKQVDDIFSEQHYESITSELLSIYAQDGSIKNVFGFEISTFFEKEQELYLYSDMKDINKKSFIGNIKFVTF